MHFCFLAVPRNNRKGPKISRADRAVAPLYSVIKGSICYSLLPLYRVLEPATFFTAGFCCSLTGVTVEEYT